MKEFIFAIASLISAQAFADGVLGINLVGGCTVKPRAPLSNCSISPVELAGKPDYETQYTVTYSHTCGGLNLGAQFSAGGVVMNTKEASLDRVDVIGNGPLRIADPDPARTRSYHVAPSCQMTVTEISAQPSTAQLASWNTARIALERDRSFYATSATMLEKVETLQPGFKLLWILAGKFTDDLQADAELSKQIAPGSSTRELISQLATSGFTLDVGSSAPPRSLSKEERDALNALLDATESVHPLPDCSAGASCTETVLLKKLSPADAQKVLELLKWQPDLDAFRATAKEARQRNVETESELLKLCLISKNFMPWGIKPEKCE